MKMTPRDQNESWGLRYQQMNAHPNENLIVKIKISAYKKLQYIERKVSPNNPS